MWRSRLGVSVLNVSFCIFLIINTCFCKNVECTVSHLVDQNSKTQPLLITLNLAQTLNFSRHQTAHLLRLCYIYFKFFFFFGGGVIYNFSSYFTYWITSIYYNLKNIRTKQYAWRNTLWYYVTSLWRHRWTSAQKLFRRSALDIFFFVASVSVWILWRKWNASGVPHEPKICDTTCTRVEVTSN